MRVMNNSVFSYIFVISWFCMLYLLSRVDAETKEEYKKRRNDVLEAEWKKRTGGLLNLTDDEQSVNAMLRKLKNEEIDYARNNKDGASFPPAMHFFKAKPFIENSEVFKFINLMPKGAVLHLHDLSMVSTDWVIKNVTYRDNLYMCQSKSQGLLLKFAKSKPKPSDCTWSLVEDKRKNASSAKEFDKFLESQITLVTENPKTAYPDQAAVWKKFMSLFTALNGILCYQPVFLDYITRALQEFYEDNVQYFEFRTIMPKIYSLDGHIFDDTDLIAMIQDRTNKFIKSNPRFFGAKVIYSIIRGISEKDVMVSLKNAVALKKTFPDFLIGYDLVGQEDSGRPLINDLDALLYPSQNNIDLKFYFHAGETDWNGVDVDLNIIDALLLNTSRIGHGFALTKHPQAMVLARKMQVPLEVNLISNQVLGLVADLRNHPVATLLSTGFPLVVSADDPSLWGAKGVSYDWYELFMGPAGAWGDLATLKQLAMDSIRFSGMKEDEKPKLMQLWQHQWDAFIKKFAKN